MNIKSKKLIIKFRNLINSIMNNLDCIIIWFFNISGVICSTFGLTEDRLDFMAIGTVLLIVALILIVRRDMK